MTDVFTPAERSAVMRSVPARDTTPEMLVRRMAHALGYRFRLQRKDLPGRPDLVFPSRRIAVFVHGCFWHGHDCARGARIPATNTDYWLAKIGRNRDRDRSALLALEAMGWRADVIWECETRRADDLLRRLLALLERDGSGTA
jgi:DNA mismatch endonuclease, patch repair protein